MAWPSARYKTATNGGSWIPGDMNGVQDQYVRTAGIERDDLETAAVEHAGLTTTAAAVGGVAVRRGASVIATEEARTNVAYGLMTTPDRVSDLVLPTDGLIVVNYWAQMKQSVVSTAKAGLFIEATQAVYGTGNTYLPLENSLTASTVNVYTTLCTVGGALAFSTTGTEQAAPPTTGVVISAGGLDGGALVVFAAAGTYDVSIQFKSASGSVTVRNRKLWARTEGY